MSGFRWREGAPDGLARALSGLSGVPWSRDDRVEGYLRGLATLVLLFAALMGGLGQLYVNNSTFGDTFLVDYAAVFLWPFGADILARGLGNLKWLPSLRPTISPPDAVANLGDSVEFEVRSHGGSGGPPAWTCASSDSSVATVVSTKGGCRATGVKAGRAIIKVVVTKGTETRTLTADLKVN